jgi:hypothetical protein
VVLVLVRVRVSASVLVLMDVVAAVGALKAVI